MDDRNSEGFSTITPEEARAMMDDGDVVILDVREPSEFATGHVPGAINVPLGEIRMGRTLPECPDLDKTVLIYCRSGRRSDIGGRIMAASGYRDVRNFLGVIQWPYELVRCTPPSKSEGRRIRIATSGRG